MRNNPLFIQLRQIALDNNYTIEQMDSATKEQAESLIGAKLPDNFFANIKRIITDELRHRDEQADMQALKSVAGNWLDTNFPNWQAERGRDKGKPFVKIWLEGKLK